MALRKWHKRINNQAFDTWAHALNSSEAANPTNCTNAPSPHINYIRTMRKHIDAVVRNYPTEFNCMRRCLALKGMIERRGGACTMHIGVNMQANVSTNEPATKLAAHAWLSINGELINDSAERVSEYTEITHSNALFKGLF